MRLKNPVMGMKLRIGSCSFIFNLVKAATFFKTTTKNKQKITLVINSKILRNLLFETYIMCYIIRAKN